MRSGESIRSILGQLRLGSIAQPVVRSHERMLRQHFLVTLMQSTAPLQSVISLASLVLNPHTKINLPPHQAFQPLKETIMTLETILGVLDDANSTSRGPVGPEDITPRSKPSSRPSGPPFWVPARGWTTRDVSDEAASKLVSLFLALINPYWRFVEEDLFLAAMRAGYPSTTYCSPLLVNAILSLVSVTSIYSWLSHRW